DQLLLAHNGRSTRAIFKQKAETALVRHGYRCTLGGKKQKPFPAAGQEFDLRSRLAAIDFKGQWKAHSRRGRLGLSETRERRREQCAQRHEQAKGFVHRVLRARSRFCPSRGSGLGCAALKM